MISCIGQRRRHAGKADLESKWKPPLLIAIEELTGVPDPVRDDETDAYHLLSQPDHEAAMLGGCDLGLLE